MRITLNKEYYKGTDGSSLSDTRCEQMVTLFDMLNGISDEFVTYKQILICTPKVGHNTKVHEKE